MKNSLWISFFKYILYDLAVVIHGGLPHIKEC